MSLDLSFPPEPRRGQPVTAAWGVAIQRLVRAALLAPGRGYRLQRDLSGTRLELLARGGGGAAAAAPHPFQLYDASTLEGETVTLKVGVRSGRVRNVVPTLDGTALDADPAPTKTITATTHFWIKVVCDFGTDTYVRTIETSPTPEQPAAESLSASGFTSCLYLGQVTVANGAITAIVWVSQPSWANLLVAAEAATVSWWVL